MAGFVVLRDREVIRAASLPAPPDADVGRQLEELHGLAAGLIEEFEPEVVAVKVNEAQGMKPRSTANRGEGAVLAAAGRAGVPIRLWHHAGLRKPAGFAKGGSLQECVEALCRDLTGKELEGSEVEQAGAVAAASLKERGG